MDTPLISITVLGGVVIPLLLPVLLVLWLWWGRFSSRWHWAAALTATGLALALLFVVSRWDVLGYNARYILPLVFLIGAASFVRQRHVLSVRPRRRRRFLLASGPPVGLLLAFLAWAWWGMRTPDHAIDLAFPLQEGTYYVLHGGHSPLLNYHGAFNPMQRHGLDIVRLDGDGRRADGLYPDDLGAYAIFGDTVHAPMDGRVLATETNRPDRSPPQRDRDRPGGNYVLLERDGLVVVLLHLKQGSILVTPGDSVSAGAPLGRVGNSGSTSEPHLHIHALKVEPAHLTSIDTVHRNGQPVPITFEGSFLVRNSRFR